MWETFFDGFTPAGVSDAGNHADSMTPSSHTSTGSTTRLPMVSRRSASSLSRRQSSPTSATDTFNICESTLMEAFGMVWQEVESIFRWLNMLMMRRRRTSFGLTSGVPHSKSHFPALLYARNFTLRWRHLPRHTLSLKLGTSTYTKAEFTSPMATDSLYHSMGLCPPNQECLKFETSSWRIELMKALALFPYF